MKLGVAITVCFLAACLAAIIPGCGNANSGNHTAADSMIIFRAATRPDLQLQFLDNVKPARDGYPIAMAFLQSTANDAILVTYGPGSLTIHCGPYSQRGPGGISGRRREILDSWEYIEFVGQVGGWTAIEDHAAELLVPTRLPPGDYDLWGTFTIPGPQGGVLESNHQIYRSPPPAGK